MKNVLVVAGIVVLAVGCRGVGSGSPQGQGVQPATFDVNANTVAEALQKGTVTLEIRGLKNEGIKNAMDATSFTHKAIVIANGNPEIAKLPFVVNFTVKRLAGGDPATPRPAESMEAVLMKNGVGDFKANGGYRLASEKWEPEQVEIAVFAILPFIPVPGPTAKN